MSTSNIIYKVQKAMMGSKYNIFEIDSEEIIYTAVVTPLISKLFPKITVKDHTGATIGTLKSNPLKSKWTLTLEDGEDAIINVPVITMFGIHFSIEIGGVTYKAPHVRWDYTAVDEQGNPGFTINKMLLEYLRNTFHAQTSGIQNPLYAICTSIVMDYRFYKGSWLSFKFFKLFRNSKPTRRAYRRHRKSQQ
ncbi:MAG: hypothetical protein KAU62_09520 [Candidatus Heimdallarchaeota archaeon]|nr:hypothetical protein [Candidatus Heimdallarchaeota archaeon]MCG3256311.1 hypothetical protein [Candidatus Heimdallarchaeota archaeon]MCK4611379.1 hypothetical protein [Candidatus Heimdallarchaeota archaeon]